MNAAALKAVRGLRSLGGSNPSASAEQVVYLSFAPVIEIVPILSPAAKSSAGLPDSVGKFWLSSGAAMAARLTVALVTVRLLVVGSIDLLPV